MKSHHLAGAGIDVFETEPPISPSHPLFNSPNVVVTPHVGFATHEAFENRLHIVIDNITAWMNGSPQNIVS